MLSTATSRAPGKPAWRENASEYNFKDSSELCTFVAHEIVRSKKKYVRIAEAAGCCPSTVGNLASGTTIYPRLATIMEILRVLGYRMVVQP